MADHGGPRRAGGLLEARLQPQRAGGERVSSTIAAMRCIRVPFSQCWPAMSYQQITYAVADGIATITLNRPEKLNAWTPIMGAPSSGEFLASLPAETPLGVAVPTGAGRRGHPLVIPAGLVPRLLSWEPDRRLSDLLREPDIQVHEIPGSGAEVLSRRRRTRPTSSQASR